MAHDPGSRGLKVLFAASEVAPFMKTGGLGDVCGSLPIALSGLGIDVTLVMPFYAEIDPDTYGITPTGLSVSVHRDFTQAWAEIWEGRLNGNEIFFIKYDPFFGRSGLYGNGYQDYPDNAGRFAFFCQAAIELAAVLGKEFDVVHVHDWQTALIPAYLRTCTEINASLARAATVLTIHNLAYQGLFDKQAFALTGLPDYMLAPEQMEFFGRISYLKAGLASADALTTVSPTYAKEIQTPEKGLGLEGFLKERAHRISGIINGADYRFWSPETAPGLPAAYSAENLTGKALCKAELLRKTGLKVAGDETCLLGFVGRFTRQKGLDILVEAIPRLLLEDVSLCILGQGDDSIRRQLEDISAQHPDRIFVRSAFADDLAHLILAGSDMIVMPSRFEPCGLTQIYAMRHGTPPIVRETGGLKDSVACFDPLTLEGTGFTFGPATSRDLIRAVREALWTKSRPDLWRAVVQNAMAQDYSWQTSAAAYADLYRRVCREKCF